MSERISALCLALLVALPAGAEEEPAPPPEFDIEVIVFRHLTPDDSELQVERADEDEEPRIRRRRFAPLEPEDLRLGGRERDRVVLDIVDFAPPVDPRRVKPRALDDVRPGGLGTHFISECMDECEFRAAPEGAGNRLWMAKRIE